MIAILIRQDDGLVIGRRGCGRSLVGLAAHQGDAQRRDSKMTHCSFPQPVRIQAQPLREINETLPRGWFKSPKGRRLETGGVQKSAKWQIEIAECEL